MTQLGQRFTLTSNLSLHIYVRNEEKVRNFVDAVHWRMKTGVSWRDLPTEFGKWNSIFRQFAR